MVVGVSFDPPAANKAFRDKFSFPYLLLSDEAKTTAIAYGSAENQEAAVASRITFLINERGVIQGVYPVRNAQDAESHAQELMNALA